MSHSKTPAVNAGDIDVKKRNTIKIIGGALGATAAGAVPTAASATPGATPPAAEHRHNLTINIQINREGLTDWVLLENLTEQPLLVRAFEPRHVHYNDRVLDLHALLSRQQRSKKQLEIWPNHAWTHSVRGATRTAHPLRPNGHTTHVAGASGDVRSVQVAAYANPDGVVTLHA